MFQNYAMEIQVIKLIIVVIALVSSGCAQPPLTFIGEASSRESSGVPCPCLSHLWCHPIHDSNRTEIFAFSVKNNPENWHKYDWTKLTTVVMVNYVSDDLMCLAHAFNTKVSYLAKIDFDFRKPLMRASWIQKQVDFMQQHFLDGINFDYDQVVGEADAETRDAFTSLVAETNTMLKKVFDYSQVTANVAWRPDADQIHLDYKGLAANSDFLFVKAYNEQSQIYGECIAMPNSGFMKTFSGLKVYAEKSVPKQKLVLGLPWYGYVYTCIELNGQICHIKAKPYRGAPCSDTVGQITDYTGIRVMSQQHTINWNQTEFTPYFTFINPKNNQCYQVHYDNPKSLRKKYGLVSNLNLRGVGIWTIDSVDYNDTPDAHNCRSEMFKALPDF